MAQQLYNISNILGLAIVNSLWQALLVYFILKTILSIGNKLSAEVKYLLAFSGLMVISGWFIYSLAKGLSLFGLMAPVGSLRRLPLLPVITGLKIPATESNRYYYNIEACLPYASFFYIAGLAFQSGRLLLARKRIAFIRRTMSIDIALQQQINTFAAMLGIRQKVQCGLSRLTDVPCMTGVLKPLVLLPFSLNTYLSAAEVDAILLHELAHIKRNDYIISMIQQVTAVLLFFNPCVILINRIINEERENSCDDLVVKVTANPLDYAKALLKVEQSRQSSRKLALAATGDKYYLLNRIQRIMKTKQNPTGVRPALLAMLILTIAMGGIALLKPQIAQGKVSINKITPVLQHIFADTSHKKAAPTAKTVRTAPKYHHHKPADTLSEAAINRKIQQLKAEIQKHSDAVNAYYHRQDFKQQQAEIEELGKQIQDFYNQPEVREQQEEMAKAGADFSKNWSDNDKLKAMTLQMGDLGKAIGAYFTSPEFKKLDAELRKKYGIPQDRHYFDDSTDENYKKYQQELESRLPADIREKTEKMKALGSQMKDQYDSPRYKAESDRMKALGDSIKLVYDNPEIKEKQKQMQLLGEQMAAYTNSDEIKQEKMLLNQAIKKLDRYLQSDEYRSYMKNYNFNDNYNQNDSQEKAKDNKQ